MSLLDPYISKLKSIEQNIEEIAKDAIRANIKEILQLNKHQMRSGLDSRGVDVADNYAPSTEEYWRFADPPKNPSYKVTSNKYDFYWSGMTQDLMYLEFKKKDEFSIFSEAPKAKFIETIYGDLFGLSPKNNDYVNSEIILPFIQKHILDNFWRV